MDRWLQLTLSVVPTTTPSPETRRAVGEASGILLAIALAGLVVVCGFLVLLLRRRSRARASAPDRDRAEPGSAWVESGRRVPLEDDDTIPREPGSA